MGAMGCSESVIDEQVGLGSQLLSEHCVVLGLLLVEPHVLQNENLHIEMTTNFKQPQNSITTNRV